MSDYEGYPPDPKIMTEAEWQDMVNIDEDWHECIDRFRAGQWHCVEFVTDGNEYTNEPGYFIPGVSVDGYVEWSKWKKPVPHG